MLGSKTKIAAALIVIAAIGGGVWCFTNGTFTSGTAAAIRPAPGASADNSAAPQAADDPFKENAASSDAPPFDVNAGNLQSEPIADSHKEKPATEMTRPEGPALRNTDDIFKPLNDGSTFTSPSNSNPPKDQPAQQDQDSPNKSE